jgi:hypothetical protein
VYVNVALPFASVVSDQEVGLTPCDVELDRHARDRIAGRVLDVRSPCARCPSRSSPWQA